MKRTCLFVLLLALCAGALFAAGAVERNLTDEGVVEFDASRDYFPEKAEIQYATGFNVAYFKNYKVLTVIEPWQDAKEPFRYILVQRGTPAPDGYDGAVVMEVPVRSFVSMSTTFLAQLDALNQLDTLTGVDNPLYTNLPEMTAGVAAGEIKNVGEGPGVNAEILIEMEADVIMTSSTGGDWDAHPKLLEAGLPVVINGEWLESDALARSEWIKFIGLFFNTEADAKTIFDAIESHYTELTGLATSVPIRPTVFANVPWQGTWYMPGGQSYVAKLFADAGADYLWADDDSTGSLYLAFEVVYERAADADMWLYAGMWNSLDDGAREDERFKEFAAFRSGRVYNNNALSNASGYSAYWESGFANPHIILTDLIGILHPELLPDHELVYFKQLP